MASCYTTPVIPQQQAQQFWYYFPYATYGAGYYGYFGGYDGSYGGYVCGSYGGYNGQSNDAEANHGQSNDAEANNGEFYDAEANHGEFYDAEANNGGEFFDDDIDDEFYDEDDNGTSFEDSPPPQKPSLFEIIEVNGYKVEVSPGQRKVVGPPQDFVGSEPGSNCELFCGHIPKDILEDELLPIFEGFGPIWELRLMMNPVESRNRGFAFVKFAHSNSAKEAVRQLERFRIRPGQQLRVTWCKEKLRLFVGNIPKVKGKEVLMAEFARRTEGLREVIVYNSPDENKNNRGFCFLHYSTHKLACAAKQKLLTTTSKLWGCDIIVDWADRMAEPTEEVMSRVKVLYVRNLTQYVTERKLYQAFKYYGYVERVKKIKDYAFVHFEEREGAERALLELNGRIICGRRLEVTWAKPPVPKKERQSVLRARERRTAMELMRHPNPRNNERATGTESYEFEGEPNYDNYRNNSNLTDPRSSGGSRFGNTESGTGTWSEEFRGPTNYRNSQNLRDMRSAGRHEFNEWGRNGGENGGRYGGENGGRYGGENGGQNGGRYGGRRGGHGYGQNFLDHDLVPVAPDLEPRQPQPVSQEPNAEQQISNQMPPGASNGQRKPWPRGRFRGQSISFGLLLPNETREPRVKGKKGRRNAADEDEGGLNDRINGGEDAKEGGGGPELEERPGNSSAAAPLTEAEWPTLS